MSGPAFGVSQVPHVCAGPAGCTELALCWKVPLGTKEERQAVREAVQLSPRSGLWRERELFMAVTNPLPPAGVGYVRLWELLPLYSLSFLRRGRDGLAEGSVPVAAGLFLETGEFGHMTVVFIHEI